MKHTIFLLFVLFNFLYPSDNSRSDSLTVDNGKTDYDIPDGWFSRDKGLHLAGSFIATGWMMKSADRFLAQKKIKSRTIGISFTVSLAVGKEFYDSRQQNNHFCYKDLTADFLGIIVALLVFR